MKINFTKRFIANKFIYDDLKREGFTTVNGSLDYVNKSFELLMPVSIEFFNENKKEEKS